MKIFAYGSNMSSKRLKERVPSASFYKVGLIKEHVIKYHKKSVDGSGKADCYKAENPEHEVWGVIFDIEPHEKPLLDSHEGKGQGYEEKTVDILCEGSIVSAVMYYATKISEGLLPYDWYINHIIIGAKEFNLPEYYISRLSQQKFNVDADEKRRIYQFSLYL